MEINTGGSAFPSEHHENCHAELPNGMTLRNYFAIHAPDNEIRKICSNIDTTVYCARYIYADAMIKEMDNVK